MERNAAALKALRRNLDELGIAPQCRVLAMTVERAIAELAQGAPHDLVLCDPPYDDVLHAALALDRLIRRGALQPDARIVLEHASRDAAPPLQQAELDRTRTYGDTAVSFYRPKPPVEPSRPD